MVLSVELEVEVEPAIGPQRVVIDTHRHVFRVADRPACEGASALRDVVLGVATDAHRKELQKLSPVVLVDGRLVVIVVVEPHDHRRVSRELHEKGPQTAHAVPAEHVYLVREHPALGELRIACGEHPVPEEGYLFLERPLAVQHTVQPVSGDPARSYHAGVVRVVTPQKVHGHLIGCLRVEQRLDGRLVAVGGVGLQLVPGGAEPSASHQVRHQRDILATHIHSYRRERSGQ